MTQPTRRVESVTTETPVYRLNTADPVVFAWWSAVFASAGGAAYAMAIGAGFRYGVILTLGAGGMAGLVVLVLTLTAHYRLKFRQVRVVTQISEYDDEPALVADAIDDQGQVYPSRSRLRGPLILDDPVTGTSLEVTDEMINQLRRCAQRNGGRIIQNEMPAFRNNNTYAIFNKLATKKGYIYRPNNRREILLTATGLAFFQIPPPGPAMAGPGT
jgi:hypothetical protein